MYTTNSFARLAVSAFGAALIATACLTAAVAPASASTVSASVHTADLNLNAPAGRAIRDARVKAAAKSLCNGGGSDLVTRVNQTRCEKAATRSVAS